VVIVRNFLSIRALVVVALAAVSPRAEAVPCASDCSRRMAECRAIQCTGIATDRCRDRCRAITGCRAGAARIRTLANVVTRCRVSDGKWSGEQRLEIQRGDCPPTTVVEFATPSAVPDFTLCQLYGDLRDGTAGVTVGPLKRLGMSPDGRTILFEVNAHNVADFNIGGFSLPLPTFEVPEEGIFAVDADGSRLRWLGPPSRERSFKGPIIPYPFPPGFNLLTAGTFNFSPDGRFVVFADRGPGTDGTDAGQLVVMDVRTGERTQVTPFGATTQSPPVGADVFGFFVDADTISGATLAIASDGTSYVADPFLVRRDGTDFRFFVPPTPIPGSQVVENFQVAGREGNVITVTMPSMTMEPDIAPVTEVWARDGNQLLQITNEGRSDTQGGALSRDGQRVFFTASTNLLGGSSTTSASGTNPMNNCQLFSVSRLGGPLRQLTHFDPPLPSDYGCDRNAAPPACRVLFVRTDSMTGTVVFAWTCDPFGLHPISSQMFAMREDGSGLRQLTNYAGRREEPDGGFSVELPGPTVYSARDQSAGRRRKTTSED
jgi:hypothetical protein